MLKKSPNYLAISSTLYSLVLRFAEHEQTFKNAIPPTFKQVLRFTRVSIFCQCNLLLSHHLNDKANVLQNNLASITPVWMNVRSRFGKKLSKCIINTYLSSYLSYKMHEAKILQNKRKQSSYIYLRHLIVQYIITFIELVSSSHYFNNLFPTEVSCYSSNICTPGGWKALLPHVTVGQKLHLNDPGPVCADPRPLWHLYDDRLPCLCPPQFVVVPQHGHLSLPTNLWAAKLKRAKIRLSA